MQQATFKEYKKVFMMANGKKNFWDGDTDWTDEFVRDTAPWDGVKLID